MKKDEPGVSRIYLNPGDIFLGCGNVRLHTVLGSCVSITLWHPVRKMGGMCHYVLPRNARGNAAQQAMDVRYAEDAVGWLVESIEMQGMKPQEFETRMYGGGEMFRPGNDNFAIGKRNIAAGYQLLSRYGFNLVGEHLAGPGHRSLVFDLSTGKIEIKQGAARES